MPVLILAMLPGSAVAATRYYAPPEFTAFCFRRCRVKSALPSLMSCRYFIVFAQRICRAFFARLLARYVSRR